MYNNSIVVAGMGRCGTTMLYRCLHSLSNTNYDSLINVQINDVRPYGFMNDINDGFLQAGHLYKTHCFSPVDIRSENDCKIKVIYMFGDPRDIVCSITESEEIDIVQHSKHLGVCYENSYFDYLYQDVFRLQQNFKSWLNVRKICENENVQVLFIRYQTIFDNFNKIKQFLQADFIVPEYKERTKKWQNSKNSYMLNKTYSELYEKLQKYEDIFKK